jgi:hypothetical protein
MAVSTAEHYAVQREAALAAMGLVLSRAGSADQVLHETLGELPGYGGRGMSPPRSGREPTG